jgi:hypothetical protein
VTVEEGAKLRNRGSGDLTLRADATSIDNGGSMTNRGLIDWSRSTGTVTALYDMTGMYTPGALKTNAAWTPAADSGRRRQITGYKLVNSMSDIEGMESDLGGSYALGKDIDANGASATPIGDIDMPFVGEFDGRGHRIESFTLGSPVPGGPTPPSEYPIEAQGLFGVIGANGIVRNVAVEGRTDNESVVQGYYAVLAGINYGTIVRAGASGSIDIFDLSFATDVGGLVGLNLGTIKQSSSTVSIRSPGLVGGLVGSNGKSGAIVQSFASGDVIAARSAAGAGGLAGSNEGTITQSYALGDVSYQPHNCFPGTGCGGSAGGLVASNDGSITQSFATGHVDYDNDPSAVGGIAGINNGRIGDDVYWDRDTAGALHGVSAGQQTPDVNGLTSAQMGEASSFAGYDFGPDGVWSMTNGGEHPVLRWQTPN